MTDEMLAGVIAALIMVAGSIVAATLLAIRQFRMAIQQFKMERGFDRQLDWCESMMAAFNRAGAAIANASEGESPGAREEAWNEAIRQYERMIPICGLKDLYAPSPAVRLIEEFMAEYERLIESHLAFHREAPAGADETSCLRKLRESATSLAALARGHLELEALPRDPAKRFHPSFRGRELGEHRGAFDPETP